jgi:D-amino-acid dehydrogenase
VADAAQLHPRALRDQQGAHGAHVRVQPRLPERAARADRHRVRRPRPGTTQLFRTQQQLDASAQDIEILAQYGVPYEVLDRAGIIQAEPALAHVDGLVGALRLPRDQTGDCQLFTRRLAQMCVDAGVGSASTRTSPAWSSMATASPACASTASWKPPTASWSRSALAALVAPLGMRLPVYPLKGYSLTLPITDPAMAPTSTILDESYKVAVTRFDDRIRVGGMAEVAGFDLSLSQRRRETLELVVSDLYPKGGDLSRAQFWTGLRPATPDGTPVIGATPFRNLYLNTGHGTLGWTMACGSGRYLADLMSARQPQISTEGLDIFRYGQYGHAPQHENRTCVLPAR